MAKLGISTGSQPNDGTGDSLIDGAVKVNSNFNEIYTTIGDGTTLAVPVTSVSSGTGISVSGSTGNVTITNIGIADTNNLRTDFLEVSGISTLSGGIEIPSNVPLKVGDITIEERTSPATGSLIETGGDLMITSDRLLINNAANTENLIIARSNGAVDLYYDGDKKFETSGAGVTVTGNITCSNIDSTNLDTGTGFLTLGNASSQFDIRFAPSTGSSPAIRWAVSDGISIMGRYNGGADLFEDIRFGTSGYPSYFKNLVPKNDSTYDLGTNTNRWAAVYSDEFHGGGANITGISTLNIVNYSGGGGGGGSDTLADVTSRGATTNQTISFSANKGISMDTASNNPFQIYGASDQKAYIAHAQNNGAGGAGDLVIIAKNGLHVYGGTSENTVNLGLEVTSGSSNLLYQGSSKLTTTNAGIDVTGNIETDTLNVSGISTFTADKVFFKNGGGTPATLQIETGYAGVGNTIRSSSSLDLATNGSAFNLYLNNDTAIIAGGTGASQYTSLYGTGAERLKTTASGINVRGSSIDSGQVQVGTALNLTYQTNTSTILHNNLNGSFDIESVSGINIKPGPSHFLVYSSDDVLRFKVKADAADLYSDINVGVSTNTVGFTSTNSVNTPALTLSHNNPTVVSTAGTTGQFKQIGGQPYYYDGTTWRALFLSEAPLTVNQADSDWDNTMIRMNFDQATIGDVTNLKDGRTPSVSLVDLVSSPIKYGTKTARFQANNTGINFTQNNSGSTYYPFEGAWTLEGWFYFNSSTLPNQTNINNSPVLFANWHPNTGVANNWKIGYYKIGSGSTYNFYWHNKNSTATGTNQPGNTTSGYRLEQKASSQFADNAWHHIAIVREPGNGSIHFYLDGIESTDTDNDELIDNEISDQTNQSFVVGYYAINGDTGRFEGNVDDIRVSKSARYTSNFTPPTSALPITGSTTTVYEPADSKVGEISLGGSPAWTGTPGVTASQVAAGQYRATFATAYSNATDYVIQTSMNDYTPATTPVGIGVSRFTTHADFFVRRVSDGANIDTGSLAIDLFKK